MAAWINLKIRASADYAHIMSDALIELGALSCAIEDSYLNSENEEALFCVFKQTIKSYCYIMISCSSVI